MLDWNTSAMQYSQCVERFGKSWLSGQSVSSKAGNKHVDSLQEAWRTGRLLYMAQPISVLSDS